MFRKIVAILGVLMPLFSALGFLLGIEQISPASVPLQLALGAICTLYAMALPVLVILFWPHIEQVILLSQAITGRSAYGTSRLRFRTSLKALAVGLVAGGVVRLLGYTRSGFAYIVLPLGAALLALQLVVLVYLLISYLRVYTYDGYVTVCRGFQAVPPMNQPQPVYEVWQPRQALRDLYLGDGGYALTEPEAMLRLIWKF